MNRAMAAGAVVLALAGGAIGAENMVGTQTQNEGLVAVKAPGAVCIDGDGADWDFQGEICCFRDISIRDAYSV